MRKILLLASMLLLLNACDENIFAILQEPIKIDTNQKNISVSKCQAVLEKANYRINQSNNLIQKYDSHLKNCNSNLQNADNQLSTIKTLWIKYFTLSFFVATLFGFLVNLGYWFYRKKQFNNKTADTLASLKDQKNKLKREVKDAQQTIDEAKKLQNKIKQYQMAINKYEKKYAEVKDKLEELADLDRFDEHINNIFDD